MPRKVLIVTIFLCLIAGGLGLMLGQTKAGKSETDVIVAAVALWAAETGSMETSTCFGWTRFEGEIWMEVSCGKNETKRTYVFDHAGNLIRELGPKT